ncbi:MAG: rhomboid family intramembrane serine protease [Rhodospirillales bacterium]|nr:MAG: rhomboid family intramembrane serine protease [Rhodospirillales bacterium]
MFLPIGDDIEREAAPFQFLTMLFVSGCVLAFGWEISLPEETAWDQIIPFTMIPAVVFGYEQLPWEMMVIPPEFTMVTSMFLHGGWEHLIGNMIFLWVFGSSVEEATGHVRFFFLYLLAGLAASFGHIMLDPTSSVPTLGASGAISGIMGAYLLVYPFNRIKVLMIVTHVVVIRVPALLWIGGWIVWQCAEIWMAAAAPQPEQAGGVAWTAHVAGFVAGMFLIVFLRRPGIKLMGETAKVATE